MIRINPETLAFLRTLAARGETLTQALDLLADMQAGNDERRAERREGRRGHIWRKRGDLTLVPNRED